MFALLFALDLLAGDGGAGRFALVSVTSRSCSFLGA